MEPGEPGGRSESGPGGGAGPNMRFGALEDAAAAGGGGAGPESVSESSSSSGISLVLEGGSAGPMDGPIEGPIVGFELPCEDGIDGPMGPFGMEGPYSSSEESLSNAISSWLVVFRFGGGDAASPSSSGVRLRFVRCGGS